MGLFDFIKGKPAADQPTSAPKPTPGASPAAPTPPAGGPRYQGSKYTAPPEPAAVPAPLAAAPEFAMPPMPFEPQNVLEQLLLLAATDENARPAFYQALLNEEVLMILAPSENLSPGEVVLQEGQEIQLQVLSDGKLPIFSSPDRLTDGGMEHGPVSYVRVPGQAFFNMVQGQDCVLNPFSPAGKILPKEELEALLAGQLVGPTSPAGGEAQVMLSQPATHPTALAEAIAAWCASQSHIQAAYLAQMQLADAPEVPRLLLGFETTSTDPNFLQELGPVLQGQTADYQFVDLMLLDKSSDEGVNPYFRTIEPFYKAA